MSMFCVKSQQLISTSYEGKHLKPSQGRGHCRQGE